VDVEDTPPASNGTAAAAAPAARAGRAAAQNVRYGDADGAAGDAPRRATKADYVAVKEEAPAVSEADALEQTHGSAGQRRIYDFKGARALRSLSLSLSLLFCAAFAPVLAVVCLLRAVCGGAAPGYAQACAARVSERAFRDASFATCPLALLHMCVPQQTHPLIPLRSRSPSCRAVTDAEGLLQPVAPCAAGGAPFALFLSGWVLPEEGPLPNAKGGAGVGRRVENLPLTRIAFPAERAAGAPGAIVLATSAAAYAAVKPAAAYKKIFAAAEATAAVAREALRALAGDAGGEGANPAIDFKEVRGRFRKHTHACCI
jgi:hypothetical protein